MGLKPRIAIIGPGRLGSALAQELRRSGYRITEIVSRNSIASRRKARVLAKKVHAVAVVDNPLGRPFVNNGLNNFFKTLDKELEKAAV